MTRTQLLMRIAGLTAVWLCAGTACAQNTCDQDFKELWPEKAADLANFSRAVEHTLSPATSFPCLSEYLKGSAMAAFAPTRQNLFKALQNYSAQQQETSTNAASASVSPVSKPTGPSAIAEEFSGVSVSSGTSALTFQLSPGTLLTNTEQLGVLLPCSPVLRVTANCVPGFWNQVAERLTLSISANTSAAAQSVKGTAITGASSSPTIAQATLSTAGTTEPSLAGFGIKGVAKYVNSSSQETNKTTSAAQKLDQALSNESAQLLNRLDRCTSFKAAVQSAAVVIAGQASEDKYLQALHDQYAILGSALMPCVNSDAVLSQTIRDFLAALLVATTLDKDIGSTRKPLLGFEYDLNTPANQSSYSSLKGNLTLSFEQTKGDKTQKDTEKADAGSLKCGTSTGLLAPLACAAASQSGPAPVAKAKNETKTAGANSPLVTINLSLAGDLYNGTPPRSVPSTERLRDFQGGAEIDLKVSTSKIPAVGTLIGDSTLAGTYYYQDQTSPSVLKGPPSSITIANLPSTATQVYTTRGPINLGQIRYGFGTGSNVSFPICFTYANRSELITHPIKGLQFGLSYNLSSLFTSAKQASTPTGGSASN